MVTSVCFRDGHWFVLSLIGGTYHAFQYNEEEFVSFLSKHAYRVICSRRIHTRIQFYDSSYSFLVPTEFIRHTRNCSDSSFIPIKCGVELEFYCPRSSTQTLKNRLSDLVSFVDQSDRHGVNSDTSWLLTYDGSLSDGPGYQSFELVSPPLPVNDLSQLQSVLALLNELNCFVNRKCGTHVHFSFNRSLSHDKLTELYHAYYNWETFFDSLVSRSRREDNNRYCLSCTGDWESSRYHKFNPKAYEKHGTVEVRQHQGTLSYIKISRWISLFCKWFPRYSEEFVCISNALDVLGFTSSEKEWYLNRMAEFE